MTTKKNVLVLGASVKPDRYSNKAIYALDKHGYSAVLVGRDTGSQVNGNTILGSIKEIPPFLKIDTVSIYLNEKNQSVYEDEIISLNPRRVIFNPGAENSKLYSKLIKNKIEVLNACTLVMLSIGSF